MSTQPDIPRQPGNNGPNWLRRYGNWMLILGLMALIAVGWSGFFTSPQALEISYSRFKTLVADEQMASVTMQGDVLTGKLKTPQVMGAQGKAWSTVSTRAPAMNDANLLPLLEARHVTIDVKPESSFKLSDLLILALPWLLLFGLFYWSYRRTSQLVGGDLGARGKLGEFLHAGTQKAEVPQVSFDDVAGQENAKREVAELVQYLKDPTRFARVGASAPRGVLLMGPPGTGKTLLARALAGEAGVPFFSISGSQFIEVFVGVGASRVRNLFAAAKASMPSIVFIDELDSIGRTRGTGLGGGHDEREQTLNQILAEMDGFTSRESVLVLAATNRPDILDPALLRPGRFDRHVVLDLPSREDRLAILRLHTRKMPLAKDVSLNRLAAGSSGFSGADLKNLSNEAAILAARENREQVGMQDFEDARDKLLLGAVRNLVIQPEEKQRLAVHESGHALVAYYLPQSDPLHKVTIIPRGRSLGETQQLPEYERYTLSEDYLRDRLAVMLAGRAAEQLLLGNVSSGAGDDIKTATSLARSMVSRWGMSKKVGPMDLHTSEDAPFLGREIAQPRLYSEHAAELVDQAVKELLMDAEQRASKILATHEPQMQALIRLLADKETLSAEQVAACFAAAGSAERPRPASALR
ncbi:MAG: ATP-dependent zinc metalloprotease FtsH [Gammaproteobacteria bacterium]|nr:ATP-dependent zinc metalloprotease FtsH [Gammaproteobacteria bacterium]